MAVTQKDIAERVGLSQPVVGRILNGGGMVSEATRARVLREAQAMGYRLNRSARSLRFGKTEVITVWVPRIETAFCSRVISIMDQIARSEGYSVQVTGGPSEFSGDRPFYGAADGILLLDPPPVLQVSLESHPGVPPAVFINNRWPRLSPRFDVISVDKTNASRQAVEHLFACGCERVAFLGEGAMPHDAGADVRYDTYVAAMTAAGRRPLYIPCADLRAHRDAAQKAIHDLLSESLEPFPDGLFCLNDDVAIGAMRSLRQAGLRVPGNVRLVGCDGIPDSADIVPALSTIQQPLDEMCQRAWDFLKERIAQPDRAPRFNKLEARLLIRDSSYDEGEKR